MRSSFQPFLISEFKTGYFNYLEPWVRPTEAFDPQSNAFVYRGSLEKRQGSIIFGIIDYRDNNIALGDGSTATFSGTLKVHPIVPGSFVITDGVEIISDNGDGTMTGNLGGSGTINYVTGAWTATFNTPPLLNADISGAYNPNVARPIMGIKQWTSEVDGTHKLVVMDTRRASVYNNSTNSFMPLDSVSQILWASVNSNSTSSITISTGWVAVSPYTQSLAPFSITVTDGTSTVTDNGSGTLSSSGNISGGTVDYATGIVTVTFTSPNTANIIMTASLVGDYFTGTNSDFFNATNWMAPAYSATNPGFLYMTNNADRITTFDGTNLARPPFSITQAHYISFTNDIAYALDVDVYKNRFLVQRPFVVGNANVSAQSIRWSAINSPTNLIADVTGNGGELSAPTDDFMQASEFLRDQLIVFFTNSAWTFRFTGSDFSPFRFDKLNNSKSTNAPYGTVPYDERITSMGSKGLIACDGVNVQRYDAAIIDQFLDINQARFGQCFGIRFDTINQAWMLYPSEETNATLSDKVLIYNFIENTWATYDLMLSCLGLYFITADATWGSFAPSGSNPLSWGQANFPWDSYLLQELAPTLLGGANAGGYVYELNDGDFDERANLIQMTIKVGTGVTTYSGILANFPVIPGTFTASDVTESFTDNGDGTLSGSVSGTGTINYETGAWSLTFTAAVPTGILITASYMAISPTAIEASVTSTRWNPFTTLGQKVQFGYIDIYYQINTECVIDLSFFVDNSQSPATTRTLTLDGPVNSDVAFKRIFINVVGEFLRMNIYNDQTENFKIIGMILWAAPSGRLTPGRSVT
jgi:hypothetical protein